MGLYQSTYFGPFVKVYNPPKKHFEEYKCCSAENCKEKHYRIWDESKKFCPSCGGAILNNKIIVNKPRPFDYYQELDETLVPVISSNDEISKNYDILICNKRIFDIITGTNFSSNS